MLKGNVSSLHVITGTCSLGQRPHEHSCLKSRLMGEGIKNEPYTYRIDASYLLSGRHQSKFCILDVGMSRIV